MKTGRKKEEEDKPTQKSFINHNDLLIEEVYSNEEGVRFAIWDGKEVKYEKKINIDGIEYIPYFGDDVTKGLVLLPRAAEDYGDEEQLVKDIEMFIKEWLGVSESYYKIATYYILTTWVYDKFDTINYLRALGDTGSGKSRFLDVIGGLCYKFTLVTGAVTPAPVFRLLEKWKGTLGIEEADLKESDETNEIIKILNCGFEKGKPVVRCDKNTPDKIDTFEVYGAKVIATRKEFYDQATEARCLTEIMIQDSSKPDTKTKEFYETRNKLRDKLLMFRFKNYNIVNVEKTSEIDLTNLEPRLRQASRGFLALVWNKPKLLGEFKVFLKDYNDKLIETRSQTWEGLVINNIAENLVDNKRSITCGDISTQLNIEKLTNRKVGAILNRLKIETRATKVEGKTKKIVNLNNTILNILFDRYIADKELCENAKISVTKSVVSKQTTVTEVTELLDTTKNKKGGEKLGKLGPSYNGNFGNPVTKFDDAKATLYGMCSNGQIVPIEQFLSCFSKDFYTSLEAMLEKMKQDGEVFEPKPGFIGILQT